MLRSALQYLALWQTKEFRWDRVTAHLQLPEVRVQLLHPLSLAKWAVLWWWLVNPAAVASGRGSLLFLAFVAAETLWFVKEIIQRSARRPRLSPRSIGLLSVTALAIALLYLVARSVGWSPIVLLLALDRGLFLLVAVAVLLTIPLASWKRGMMIRQATQRLRGRTPLRRVGITGSFGKSSTKEFLATLAEGSFRVLKTPATINADVGIAQVVLRDLDEQHTLFVAEMGAYRQGEIARSAEIVKPDIGILTAVRKQHLALFGSSEALARAKGELLRALPPEGTAIINGDDPVCLRLAKESPAKRVIRYGLGEGNDVRGDVRSVHRDRFQLTVRSGGATHRLEVPLLGTHHARNLLGAWAAAEALGIPANELAARVSLLRPLPRTMEPRTGPRGSLVVDDTYSANPDGVIAALEYLPATQKKTTVVILTTMIELGSESASAHRRVGETLRQIRPTLTVVTSKDFSDDLLAGASNGPAEASPRIMVEPHPQKAFALVEPLLGTETAVLLEGRIPETLRQKFLQSS